MLYFASPSQSTSCWCSQIAVATLILTPLFAEGPVHTLPLERLAVNLVSLL